jgi:hydrogenase expression/formation protein HypD
VNTNFVKIFRSDKSISRSILENIYRYVKELNGKNVKVINFCGTHEWTTTYYGIRNIIPREVELIAGPGCPVCITPASAVEVAIKLALSGIRVYTFGDAFKLPTSSMKSPRSLAEAASIGGNVKVVYSFIDAVKDAAEYKKEAVFLGIGFETTAPSYTIPFKYGKVPRNLRFLSVLRLTPPIMRHTIVVHFKEGLIDLVGVVAPGHVSTVIGASAWEFLPRDYRIPTVVAGFEPLDVMLAIEKILYMLIKKKPGIYIEYSRSVTWSGNLYAKATIEEVFTVIDATWRGIGLVPQSGLALADKYKEWDAFLQYGIPESSSHDTIEPPGCRCGEVVLGMAKPTQCPLFMKMCTPERPYGPCMVSSEGTCLIWALYGGYTDV